MFQQDVVKVFTAEQCVTIGRFHLKHTLLNFQDGYVERSSSEIIHSNATAIPMQQNQQKPTSVITEELKALCIDNKQITARVQRTCSQCSMVHKGL